MRQSRKSTMPGAVGFRIFMGWVVSGLCVADEILHRFLCSAGAVRDSCHRESHFHAGERSHKGQIVQVAEVADAKDLASELRKAGAQGHVEPLQDGSAKRVGVV